MDRPEEGMNDEDRGNPGRGIVIALLISIPIWALIIWGIDQC